MVADNGATATATNSGINVRSNVRVIARSVCVRLIVLAERRRVNLTRPRQGFAPSSRLRQRLLAATFLPGRAA
jgi:hypothetical protein